jgi:hypothetical protein
MKKKYLLFISILIFLITEPSFSQDNSTPENSVVYEYPLPAFIKFSTGMASSQFRDFATSPLNYEGSPIFLGLSRFKQNNQFESEWGGTYLFGSFINDYNNHYNSATTHLFTLYYTRLYQVWNTDKWNLKIGGKLDIATDLRINPAFRNNSVGLEMFPTIFGTIKIEKDISRNTTKVLDLWFHKFVFLPREIQLSYSVNIGLINSTFRNGYIYAGQSGITNSNNILNHYEYNIFSGFRLNSALHYTISLRNKNYLQFSYLWDVFQTDDKYDAFEMSYHAFKISFLFNTNNE